MGYITQLDDMNKLFCTFSQKEYLDDTLNYILDTYDVSYGKIFVLVSPESEEYMCTYNVDNQSTSLIENTIMLHRKKEYNTLYTINALNALIRSLNQGYLDTKFPINWNNYSNCILLTQGDQYKKLNTIIHKVVRT